MQSFTFGTILGFVEVLGDDFFAVDELRRHIAKSGLELCTIAVDALLKHLSKKAPSVGE